MGQLALLTTLTDTVVRPLHTPMRLDAAKQRLHLLLNFALIQQFE